MTKALETFEEKASIIQVIIRALQKKHAQSIVSLDISHIDNAPTDSFVICHGGSDRQVEAIAHEVESQVKTINAEKPYHREGFDNKEWILLDYVNVVVHIFQEQKRDFYALEDLWGDAKIEHFQSEEK